MHAAHVTSSGRPDRVGRNLGCGRTMAWSQVRTASHPSQCMTCPKNNEWAKPPRSIMIHNPDAIAAAKANEIKAVTERP